jgi:prevent-host-death family protein
MRQHFADVVNRVYRRERRFVIEKSGIPVAAVVSVADARLLERLDREEREARAVVDAMRRPFVGVPADEMEAEIARAVAEARERRTSSEIQEPAGR